MSIYVKVEYDIAESNDDFCLFHSRSRQREVSQQQGVWASENYVPHSI